MAATAAAGVCSTHAERNVSVRKLGVLAVLTAAFFWAGLAGAATSDSQAGTSYFCRNDGTSVLVGPDGYCVSARFYTLKQVLWQLTNGSGVLHCAVAKWNSDGSGSNAIPAQCGTGQSQLTPCVSPREAFAKGTNESASAHYYKGAGFWGTTCLS